MRPRDARLERELVALAVQAAGVTSDLGLREYADHRALPGGVRLDLDPIAEAREELADACNYLIWGIEPLYARYLAGDPEAADLYERMMRTLSGVIAAWCALHTSAA